MNKVIGTVTTYHGDEHPYLRGHKVRIVAVLKNALLEESSALDSSSGVDEHAEGGAVHAAKPDIDVDGPDYDHISDDEDLARAGGVTRDDRIEVQPWIEREDRFSFVTSDPRAVDLGCFESLAGKGGGGA